MNLSAPKSDGLEVKSAKPTIIPLSSDPKANSKHELEGSSLQRAIEKNKESLKVKLMLRRPISQLIDQGILPSLKSPTAFHEQRQKLERAKMGDLLKSKIQKRPDRQALVQQHILEDTTADSTLQEKQRQLKKARLVEGMNHQVSQCPGPLELVKGSILEADEMLVQAVREVSIPFRNTPEDSSPMMRALPEDDSGSDCPSSSPPYNFNEHSQGSFPSPLHLGSPSSARTSFSLSPPSSVSSPLAAAPVVVSPPPDQGPELVLSGLLLPGKEAPGKNRKKSKPKTQPKARTIKFHEYKGPPSAQKNAQPCNASTETSYDLLLQQQQLFLQWQLEWQQKYPQGVPNQMPNGEQSTQPTQNQSAASSESPNSPQKVITKLEDLKVSDLKAELKKRNLPVSGPKPILIERLKTYAESSQSKPPGSCSSSSPSSASHLLLDALPPTPTPSSKLDIASYEMNGASNADLSSDIYGPLESGDQGPPCQQACHLPMDVDASICQELDSDASAAAVLTNEAIVQLQQRCIEKLQLELQKSQLQLQQSIIGHQPTSQETPAIIEETKDPSITLSTSHEVPPLSSSASAITNSAVTSTSASATSAATNPHAQDPEEKLRQRQLIHEQLQRKIQILQLQQHRRKESQEATACANKAGPSALTALLQSEPISSPVEIELPEAEEEAKPLASYAEGFADQDFPGVVPLIPGDGISSQRTSSLPSFSALVGTNSASSKPTATRSNTDPLFLISRPPPNYSEATKQLNKMKQQLLQTNECNTRHMKKPKSSVKCQAVDDVLEILIKNGELPPSAAQTPKPELPSPPLYQTSAPSTSAPALPINASVVTTPIASTPCDADKQQTVNMHMSSLQSVLDMTPPSSAGFGEPNHHTPSSLDFDFHLDVEDIEVMDLEGLAHDGQQNIHLEQSLPASAHKPNRTSRHPDPMMTNGSVELMDYQNKNMDADIIEWLELLGENTSRSLTSSSSYHHPSYSIANEHDPMLSNIGQESLDLFSVDDMDFKPSEVSLLSWDKTDFAT